MDIKLLQRNWNAWGKRDAMYAVLTDPSKRHNRWTPEEFFATGEREIASVVQYLDALENPPARGEALDFGCGVGRLTQALAGRFGRATGVDIAPSMIEQARQLNRKGDQCQFRLNETPDLRQFDDGAFDFVYSNIVLQHIPTELSHGYIREFIRVLRPAGVALFQLPAEKRERGQKLGPAARAKGAVAGVINGMSVPLLGRRLIPEIDMHATPRPQVERLVAEAGGRVTDVREDDGGGQGWLSYRYCVTRA